jgi:aromatic ring-opening dioxygenase LigB subunit
MVVVGMSGVVFAAVMPHGYMAVPEACAPEEGDLGRATQQAMLEIGRRFDAARPDVTVILSPHNVHIDGHMAVIVAGKLAGSLSNWTQQVVELRALTDIDLARASLAALQDAGIPAVGVSYGGNATDTATAPMDWATLIPLWFAGGRAEPPVPVVVVCPARDLPATEHIRAGQILAEAAAASGKRVALIASSDQAHTHREGPPYGFDPAGAEFDARIVDAVRRNRLGEILDIDPALLDAAKADSYWQMLMLHGALGEGWQGDLLSYEVPTYFGMLCAAYRPLQTASA